MLLMKKLLSENANKDAKTISVQRDLLAGISSRDYYLNKNSSWAYKISSYKRWNSPTWFRLLTF